MITAADAEFHQPDSDDPTWGETNFFGFYSAEEPLNVGIYTLFRPNLGVVLSTISMNSGDAIQPWRADFCDHQAQLPIPTPRSLANYTLTNGLSVRTVVPNEVWEIGFDDGQGTTIDVTYRALMPAFDIHDPAMDPIAAAEQEAARQATSQGEASGFAWGTAYNGHFDQTGHVTGEVVLRGRRIGIDCVSTMDHSWGPRPERGAPPMSWLHAHFSKALAIHAILSFDPARDNGRELWLAHGYVLERGQVHGLKAGTGQTVRLQLPLQTLLSDRCRIDRAFSGFAGELAGGLGDFRTRAIIEGDDKRQPTVFVQALHGAFEAGAKVRTEGPVIADEPEADALLGERVEFTFEVIAKQTLEIGNLFLCSTPIFRGKSIERKDFDAILYCSSQGTANGLGARTVTGNARKAALLCPAAVAIHDDGDVARDRPAFPGRFLRFIRRGGRTHLPRISFSLVSAATSISLIVSSVSFCTSFSRRLRSSSLISCFFSSALRCSIPSRRTLRTAIFAFSAY